MLTPLLNLRLCWRDGLRSPIIDVYGFRLGAACFVGGDVDVGLIECGVGCLLGLELVGE